MKERFKQLCLVLGYNQQSFADKLSIDVRKLRSYLYETKNVPLNFLISLNEILNVNINWFITGKGNMFDNVQNNLTLQNIISKFSTRLNEIQEKTNLSDNDFSKVLNLEKDEYLEFKNGDRKPNLKILNALKQNFNLSIDWLLYDD